MIIIDKFIEYNQKRFSERTQKEYRRDLSQLSQWLQAEGKTLEGATKADLDDYLNTVPGGKNITNRRLATFKSFYNFLEDRKAIDKSPAGRIRVFKTPETIKMPISVPELNHLLSACEGAFRDEFKTSLSRLIISTFFYTGIRISELIGIDIWDVDLEDRTIKVLGKGDRERMVNYSEHLKTLFTTYLDLRSEIARENEPAFFVSADGNRITYGKVEYIFTRLKKLTGITFHPHLLRHTWASEALARGMPLAAVQSQMGHRNLSTTSRYIHTTTETKESYDKAFGKE